MLKIFAADDEELIRAGIRNCIENHSQKCSMCGEAPDGEMALPLIQELKPDILIADVCMPFMDGLELSAAAKKNMPWLHIIILSGHDEFEYAQKAVSIGIDAYILKPVNSEKLLEAIDTVIQRIEQERQEYQNIEKNLMRGESEKTIIREHFLSRLLTEKVSVNEVIDFSHKHQLDVIAKKYVVCRIELIKLEDGEMAKIRLMSKQLFEHREDCIWFIKGADCFVFIVKGEDEEIIRETAYEIAQILRHQFKLYFTRDILVGIGSVAERISDLPRSYENAQSVVRSFYPKKNCVIGFDDVQKHRSLEEPAFLATFLPDFTMAEKLRHITKKDIPRIIEKHFGSFRNSSANSILYRYYLMMDLLVTVFRLTGQINEGSQTVTPQKMLAISESWETCMEYTKLILDGYIEQRDHKEASPYSREIQGAKAYIDRNYGEASISLHTVAREVGFSPNHFSAVFSQETGETFIEYLTHQRIAAAKELLLHTSKRASDIAFEIGYSDSHYFSHVFKKNVGQSPKEFRHFFKQEHK